MVDQDDLNYQRIERAIAYICTYRQDQPSLDDIARHVHLSSHHFQKIFTKWAGVSPKKFMQFLTLDHAKTLLKQSGSNLLNTAYDIGLSGPGRLHDLFISIEGMTPGDYKNGGQNLQIFYHFAESLFGPVLIASTSKGICHLSFMDDQTEDLARLQTHFPQARFIEQYTDMHASALQSLGKPDHSLPQIKLHLQGSAFQLKVWEGLLRIPFGQIESYSQLAQSIQNPNAIRAVGTAIGLNPIAYLIPCHRVIQKTGSLGQYHWGATRKAALIGWEAAQLVQSG